MTSGQPRRWLWILLEGAVTCQQLKATTPNALIVVSAPQRGSFINQRRRMDPLPPAPWDTCVSHLRWSQPRLYNTLSPIASNPFRSGTAVPDSHRTTSGRAFPSDIPSQCDRQPQRYHQAYVDWSWRIAPPTFSISRHSLIIIPIAFYLYDYTGLYCSIWV